MWERKLLTNFNTLLFQLQEYFWNYVTKFHKKKLIVCKNLCCLKILVDILREFKICTYNTYAHKILIFSNEDYSFLMTIKILIFLRNYWQWIKAQSVYVTNTKNNDYNFIEYFILESCKTIVTYPGKRKWMTIRMEWYKENEKTEFAS